MDWRMFFSMWGVVIGVFLLIIVALVAIGIIGLWVFRTLNVWVAIAIVFLLVTGAIAAAVVKDME